MTPFPIITRSIRFPLFLEIKRCCCCCGVVEQLFFHVKWLEKVVVGFFAVFVAWKKPFTPVRSRKRAEMRSKKL